MDFVELMEKEFGKQAKKVFVPMQPGDVYATFADVDALRADVGFAPSTPIEVGINRFAEWYKNYYT
jgi:UDP-glucuronate 4-epimerase